MEEILNQYIPSMMEPLDESTKTELYRKGLDRYNELISTDDKELKINALSFIEYIIYSHFSNSQESLHFIEKINKAFEVIKKDCPEFHTVLNMLAERMLKAFSTEDIFGNQFDWNNLAVELLVVHKLLNKGLKILDFEYQINDDNKKSIDVYAIHEDFGKRLCEFRSIHIDLNTDKTVSEIKKRIKKIIKDKIKDKTKGVNVHSLPAPLCFLFVIQIRNSSELSQELLKEINSINLKEEVLPLMVCRLGRKASDNKSVLEIVQVSDLIE